LEYDVVILKEIQGKYNKIS